VVSRVEEEKKGSDLKMALLKSPHSCVHLKFANILKANKDSYFFLAETSVTNMLSSVYRRYGDGLRLRVPTEQNGR
jgi:hypothetical protein